MNWVALSTTFKLAAITSLILLTLGIPIAYWLTYSKWKWKFLVEAVVALPLVLPPTVLGFYVLVAIGPRSPLGRGYEGLVGHPLPFTFEGPGPGLDALQSAVRGSTHGHGVRVC